MSSRKRYLGRCTLILAVAAWGCSDRPTEVVRVPGVELSAVKFWDAGASVRWNRRATDLLALHPPGNAQAATSRMLTYLSIAQYRAALAAEAGMVESMHPSVSAAVGGASAAVLTYFFSAESQHLADALTADLAAPGWPGEQNDDAAAGEAIGRTVGAAVISQASTDNYLVAFPVAPPARPENWIPSAAAPIVRSLYGVRPFFLTSFDELRPPPPPTFGGSDYLDALHEIRAISDTRTAEQITIAQTYAWQTAPFTAGNLNLIADQMIVDHHRTETEAARILAYANAAAFDAQIACFDAKFAYWFIRPTQADPGIQLITTPPPAVTLPNHPSYPSGHSCITAAILTVLSDAFPSESQNLDALITQIGLSRMYAGLHYRFDVEAGQTIGRGAAALALAGSLK